MRNNEVPLISILVAVYNLEDYIKQCLDSILTQKFENYEIILVDNGSTDNSIKICEKYAKDYPHKIRYKKFGLPTVIGRPYDFGLDNMKGSYFMSVDGDDYLIDGALQLIADIIKQEHTDIIMGTFLCDIEEGMTNFKDAEFDKSRINNVSYEAAIEYLSTLPNFHTVQWRYILSKKIAKSENNKDLMYSEIACRFGDTISTVEFFYKSKSIFYMDKPFYIYRRRKTSLLGSPKYNLISIDFLKCCILIIEKMNLGYKRRAITEYCEQQIEVKFELFRMTCNTIDFNEYVEISNIIKNYLDKIYNAGEISVNFDKFRTLITKHEVLEGLLTFKEIEKVNLYKKLKKYPSNEFYVFPTGFCGECTCLMLQEMGVVVKGFIDNDKNKTENKFLDLPCFLPDNLNNISKGDSVVVIATAYSELRSKLKKQLEDIGVKNIIIR